MDHTVVPWSELRMKAKNTIRIPIVVKYYNYRNCNKNYNVAESIFFPDFFLKRKIKTVGDNKSDHCLIDPKEVGCTICYKVVTP